MATHITDKHRQIFTALTSGQYSNFALVSTEFDGIPTVAIVIVNPTDGGMFEAVPLAIMTQGGPHEEDLRELLANPALDNDLEPGDDIESTLAGPLDADPIVAPLKGQLAPFPS